MLWELVNSMNTARSAHEAFGIYSNAIVHGGSGTTDTTEAYDGINWSYINNPSNGRYSFGAGGGANAGFIVGGAPATQTTEEFDGTNWSFGGTLTERYNNACTGSLNAGLNCGGYWNGYLKETNEYDGTSWTIGGNLIRARRNHGSAGSQNAAIAIGGYDSFEDFHTTEEYNGTSWSWGGNLNTPKRDMGVDGSQNLALAFNGHTGTVFLSRSERYNGSTWSNDADLNLARYTTGCGDTNAMLAAGGYDGSAGTAQVEHYFEGYFLTGTVTNTISETIENAFIKVGAKEDYSDNEGNYSIAVESGNYNITTTHPNYFADVYNASIPPTSSYNPILYPLPPSAQTKDLLTVNNPIEANEESNIDISITKNFNNSIVSQINKKTEIVYNFVDLTLNESAKEMYYDFIGCKIKTLSIPALNQSISNVFIIGYSTEKMKSNTSYWISKLSFLKI